MQYLKRSPPKDVKKVYSFQDEIKNLNVCLWKLACEGKVFLGNRYTVSNSIGIVGLSCFYAINMSKNKTIVHINKKANLAWLSSLSMDGLFPY